MEADTTMTLQGGVRCFSFVTKCPASYLLQLIFRGWHAFLYVLFEHLPIQAHNFIYNVNCD